jgi:Protein of unknown function (DUF4238)
MSEPKLHHYVPQFYLRRFTDTNGLLWVWNKLGDVTFGTNPARVAAETNFYRMQEFEVSGHDPNTMEKQLSELEGQVSLITGQWLERFSTQALDTQIQIPASNREIVALYIAVQYLRTADARDILCALSASETNEVRLSAAERTHLHASLMWDLDTVQAIRDRIKNSVWIFGRNETETPFITSDNPVAFRTADNRQWLRLGVLSSGVYVVYPLSPTIVMYCYERSHWERIAKFDCSLSPVRFTGEMVESENSGQVFMATRFVFSPINDFQYARDFASSIGTDRYRPPPSSN